MLCELSADPRVAPGALLTTTGLRNTRCVEVLRDGCRNTDIRSYRVP